MKEMSVTERDKERERQRDSEREKEYHILISLIEGQRNFNLKFV